MLGGGIRLCLSSLWDKTGGGLHGAVGMPVQ